MKSYHPLKVFFITFFFLAAIVFLLTGLIITTFWFAWKGSWFGIAAVVIAHYLGVISRAISK